MASPRDFIHNVARAVEAGLDKETALRSLTLTPAEFFGVADRLGSIDKGKTANLLAATGDLFDARTKIKHVFVDGRKYDIPEKEAAGSDDRIHR
jgi:imidazolonepropionase-like amidohydrolase